MANQFAVAILVGSLRRESLSRKLANALSEQAPEGLSCRIVEIGNLPLYNEDLDGDAPPAEWNRFRADIRQADAVLFVTPEYNRSIPGCLKNAVDVGSRPPDKSVFSGVPAGVVSVTPYKLGAFGANHALRQTFAFLDMPVMQQPEAYIGGAGDLFDDGGKLKSDETREFLAKFMAAFSTWVKTVRGASGAQGFGAFLTQRETIAQAYSSGDAAPLDAIVTSQDPASFFSPRGDAVHGAVAVASSYREGAAMFEPPARSRLEIIQSGASGDLAFWTGFQFADVHMKEKKEATSMKLRITEVFRFEQGGWKLVHRHADMADDEAQR